MEFCSELARFHIFPNLKGSDGLVPGDDLEPVWAIHCDCFCDCFGRKACKNIVLNSKKPSKQ